MDSLLAFLRGWYPYWLSELRAFDTQTVYWLGAFFLVFGFYVLAGLRATRSNRRHARRYRQFARLFL